MKIKQVKLFTGDIKSIEQELNGFYLEHSNIISSKFISKEPLVLQIVYLMEMPE